MHSSPLTTDSPPTGVVQKLDGETELGAGSARFPILGPLRPLDPDLGGRAVAALEALERRVLVPARLRGHELVPFGITRVPPSGDQLELVADAQGKRWVLATPAVDPTALNGRIPIPDIELRRLRDLHEAGVRVDHLRLAHELPASWMPGQPLPELVPDPPRLLAADRVVLSTTRAVGAILLGLGAVAAAIAVAPAVLVVGAASLDPIVVAGVASQEADAVAWVVLSAWVWPPATER